MGCVYKQSSELLWRVWTKTSLGTWEEKWSAGPGAVHSCRGTQVGQGNWSTCYRWEEAQAAGTKNPDVPQPLKTCLLLLLLSRFSRVRLCVTPETAAHQASPSLGFSRQEHWSGSPFPSPTHESEKWKWSRSVVFDSSDPMDCSPPGSSIHGIFQAKVLE